MASEGLKTIVSGIHMAYFKSHVKLGLASDGCVLLQAFLSRMLAFLHIWRLYNSETVMSVDWPIRGMRSVTCALAVKQLISRSFVEKSYLNTMQKGKSPTPNAMKGQMHWTEYFRLEK